MALNAIVCGVIRSARFNGVNSARAEGRMVATCRIFPVLFQEPGGGVGNPERFALHELHRSRLAIKDKTQKLFGMRPTGVTGF